MYDEIKTHVRGETNYISQRKKNGFGGLRKREMTKTFAVFNSPHCSVQQKVSA